MCTKRLATPAIALCKQNTLYSEQGGLLNVWAARTQALRGWGGVCHMSLLLTSAGHAGQHAHQGALRQEWMLHKKHPRSPPACAVWPTGSPDTSSLYRADDENTLHAYAQHLTPLDSRCPTLTCAIPAHAVKACMSERGSNTGGTWGGGMHTEPARINSRQRYRSHL
jgi:hypothetical protein